MLYNYPTVNYNTSCSKDKAPHSIIHSKTRKTHIMTSNDQQQPPPAQGVRQQWADIPPKIRALIEAQIGSAVIQTKTQVGGFSPGVAARLFTADERCFFLKAVGTNLNPTSIFLHRREIQINTNLPENVFAPRLLWSVDDANDTEWVALLFDNIAGTTPSLPWQEVDLRRVMQALGQLTETLTPSPIDSVPNASDYFATHVHGWQTIKDNEPKYAEKLTDWSQRHLDTLCQLEKDAPESVKGDTLVHFDIRADNILLTDDTVWFVDWPHACLGAPWLDVVLFIASVAMQSDLSSQDLLQQHPASRTAKPEAVTATLVSFAGMLSLRALSPPPPGLPTLRAFQAGMAEVTCQWIAQRTGLV